MKKKHILCSGLRTYALSAEWKKMTYQGSFTTPQDIYVYQEPQPQQPIQKPYNPHPGVSWIFLVINIFVSIFFVQKLIQYNYIYFYNLHIGRLWPSSTTSNATNLNVWRRRWKLGRRCRQQTYPVHRLLKYHHSILDYNNWGCLVFHIVPQWAG